MPPVGAASAATKQAEQLRQDGNNYFKKDKFGAAIDAYTEAIALCPNVAIYWTNRALCHRKKDDWSRVEEDCRRAIELDRYSVKIYKCLPWMPIKWAPLLSSLGRYLFLILVMPRKLLMVQDLGMSGFLFNDPGYTPGSAMLLEGASKSTRFPCRGVLRLDICNLNFACNAHYMLGLALRRRHEFSEGAKELEKALDLGRGEHPNGYMVEEIWQELAKAKYLEWELESSKRYWDLHTLKEACEVALNEKHLVDVSQMEEGLVDEALESNARHLTALDCVFRKAAEEDMPTEVPDYLCCKIALVIFRDPVITPSGSTYERAVILDHLQRVGKFDPLTREPLNQSQLIPNLAIKEAVAAYLEKHGWAYKMD